jgi:hypothetical protein
VISRRRVLIFWLVALAMAAMLWKSAAIVQAQSTMLGRAGPVANGDVIFQATPAPPTPTATASTSPSSTQLPVDMSIGNDTCLNCHGKPGLSTKTQDGQLFGLYVPADHYNASVHGSKGYACVQCHTTVGNYPHPPFQAADARDATLKLNQVCQRCHSYQFEKAMDSVHAQALKDGNRQAAVCTDCHTAHEVKQITYPGTRQLLPEARVWSAQVCGRCHNSIYQTYAQSVHGSALLGEGNPDVPTCIDCHGVHNIANPESSSFRTASPLICARCHADAQLMEKYNISTQVFNTYVADFHGTTVTLFEKQSPDAQTNKATCYDCHGSHDISRTDDPHTGLEIQANMLVRCQQCHPDAGANFPTAWLSHYIPTWQTTPLIMSVQWFYRLLIPTVLGGMAILVALDASVLIRRRLKKRHHPEPAPQPEAAAAQEAVQAQDAVPAQDTVQEGSAIQAEPVVEADIADQAQSAVTPEATPVEPAEAAEPAAPGEVAALEEPAAPLESETPSPPAEAAPGGDQPTEDKTSPGADLPPPEDTLPGAGGQDETNRPIEQ